MRKTVITTAIMVAVTATLVALPASAQERQCSYTGVTTWNVKESFNNYIEGFIANGPQYQFPGGIETRDGIVTTGEKAERTFTWPVTAFERNRIEHSGGVHYTGHNKYDGVVAAEATDHFALDNDFSNLTVEVSGQSGRILLDYVSRDFVDTSTVAKLQNGTQVEVATINFDAPVDLTTNATITAVGSAHLTDNGESMFGGFYEVGAELADVELDLRVRGCSSTEPSPEPPITPPAQQIDALSSGSSIEEAESGLSKVLEISTLVGLGGLGLAILGYFIDSVRSWMR